MSRTFPTNATAYGKYTAKYLSSHLEAEVDVSQAFVT